MWTPRFVAVLTFSCVMESCHDLGIPCLSHPLESRSEPGIRIEGHYFWLVMTFPKPAVQLEYPQEHPRSISTR